MRRDERPPSDRERLEHMLAAARDAVAMSQGRRRADLDTDIMLQHAPVRCVQIVGEAAARVSEEGRQRVPGLPWPRQRLGFHHVADTWPCEWSQG
jgi:uncharacterized protein with HEPN domain